MRDYPCTCGHVEDEHSDTGECEIEGCLCACFEPDDEMAQL